MELSVHAKPDLNGILLGTDVNITGPFTDSLAKNRIDQADHRRFPGHILQRGNLDILILFVAVFRPGFNFQVFQSRVHAGLDAIKIADQLIDFPLRADRRFHLAIGHPFNRVEGIDIQRVGGGDG